MGVRAYPIGYHHQERTYLPATVCTVSLNVAGQRSETLVKRLVNV